MKQFFIQFLKDFQMFFSGVSFYAVIAAYCIFSSFCALYLGDYFLLESDIMNAFFAMQPLVLLLTVPANTMRLWADEEKNGTLELLLTQPISYAKLVLAKFFASYIFFAFMIATSLPLLFVSEKLSVLDSGLVYSAYTGLLLCGAFFTAVGCLISALCKNTILSYLFTVFILFFLMQAEFPSSEVYLFSLQSLNFTSNYRAFLSGILNFHNFIYFLTGTSLCLWLNTLAVAGKKASSFAAQKGSLIFTILLLCVWATTIIGNSLLFKQSFDITDEKKFTMSSEDKKFLNSLEKRIDITFYTAKSQRDIATSNYTAYAEFVEKTLNQIEKQSHGTVRTEAVQVPPFSKLETSLIRDKNIWYEEDKFGQKVFMAAEFSDNNGNFRIIPYFSSLRQNLLETDIIRILKQFGQERPKVAVFSGEEDWKEMATLNGILTEFYDLHIFRENPVFIPAEYKSLIIINPANYSTESFLALEQYVLNGGHLIIFNEPALFTKSFADFMNNFGITTVSATALQTQALSLGAATPVFSDISKDIRSVLINGTGSLKIQNSNTYNTFPVLQFSDNIIAAVSIGKYASNYTNMAIEGRHIEPFSVKDGMVFFFYDTDLLKDYLYVLEEAKSSEFYQTIPAADNFLFLLRLIDFTTESHTEKDLTYRHYPLNQASIGNAIFANIKKRYEQERKQTEDTLRQQLRRRDSFYNFVKNQGYASMKDIGDINQTEQLIEEQKTALNKLKAQTAYDYQLVISGITLILIFVVPAVLLLCFAFFAFLFRRYKQNKIRRLTDVAKTH